MRVLDEGLAASQADNSNITTKFGPVLEIKNKMADSLTLFSPAPGLMDGWMDGWDERSHGTMQSLARNPAGAKGASSRRSSANRRHDGKTIPILTG